MTFDLSEVIGRCASVMLALNPRLTGGWLFFAPPPLVFFRDISQSYKRIITKFSIPSKRSIWHILTKRKLDTSHTSTTNDVIVTSCFPGFRQKHGFAGNDATQTAAGIEPNGFQQEFENERCYQTAISDFQNFENLGKLL